jgi:hypothetical protein
MIQGKHGNMKMLVTGRKWQWHRRQDTRDSMMASSNYIRILGPKPTPSASKNRQHMAEMNLQPSLCYERRQETTRAYKLHVFAQVNMDIFIIIEA